MIKLILILATAAICPAQPVFSKQFIDTLISCNQYVDSIKQKTKNGEQVQLPIFEQILTKPQKLQYSVLGFGPSYFKNADIPQLSYDFYGGHFWQLNDAFSIGLTGEVLTEFSNAIFLDAALSTLYYPFYGIIMPFGGLCLGPGFIHTEDKNNIAAFTGLQIGGILPKTFPFVIMVSGRMDIILQRLPLPLVYSLRIGTAW